MRRILLATALAVSCLASPALAQQADEPAQVAAPPSDAAPAADQPAAAQADSDAERAAEAQRFYDSLDKRTGAMMLAQGKVQLTVPDTHYFIGPDDSRRVLVDQWHNPPQSAEGIEGMIFPAGANPAVSGWGAVLEYSRDGHVKDDDAKTINYDDLLRDLQKSTREQNAERRRAGFEEMTLTGWAEPPRYDPAAHTLYWAKLLSTPSGEYLNYDIRVLGREGVFVVSFVAGPDDLETIHASTPAVLAMPVFTAGNRYADYREGVDKTATYGIAGLIAGGVAVAAAKKFGLLALILAFGKKGIALIAVAGAAIAARFRRMFGGRKQAAAEGAADPPA
jgi:uncharacterized membrane-anchored protein